MENIINRSTLTIYYLPLFFFFHGLNEYKSHIPPFQALILLLYYLAITFILQIILNKIYREKWKSALFNLYILFIFFFFSALHKFLISLNDDIFVTSYTFILPAVVAIGSLLSIFIKMLKRRPFIFFKFIHIFFSIILIIEILSLFFQNPFLKDYSSDENHQYNHDIVFKKKPSIYLLVFDEYASSQSLFSRFKFRNNLDSSLKSQGFHIFNNSSSNYNFTNFSIASFLNIDLLNPFNYQNVTHKDYLWSERQILRNKTIEILEKNNYEINNLSIFDFKNQPARRTFYLLPNKTLLLRNRTFFIYVINDIGWHLLKLKIPFLNVIEKKIYDIDFENKFLIKHLIDSRQSKSKKHQFYYAHFMMPHPPYFYDQYNKLRPRNEVLEEARLKIDPTEGYINNINHTNNEINYLVKNIKKKEKNDVIIFILGDHGYRQVTKDPNDYFSNYNALYLPSYLKIDHYPEKITLVNQIRFIFNHLAEQNEPFLKDSLFLLKDAPVR